MTSQSMLISLMWMANTAGFTPNVEDANEAKFCPFMAKASHISCRSSTGQKFASVLMFAILLMERLNSLFGMNPALKCHYLCLLVLRAPNIHHSAFLHFHVDRDKKKEKKRNKAGENPVYKNTHVHDVDMALVLQGHSFFFRIDFFSPI